VVNSFSMRIAYLECFSGMSGDMFLGALVDAGVPPRTLEETVAALGIGARLEVTRVLRSGISATKVDVWVDGKKICRARSIGNSKQHRHENHEHSHAEHEHHAHSHPSSGEASRTKPALSLPKGVSAPHEHSHGRGLTEIRGIISAASISAAAKKTAIAIFEALGQAEAKIHNTSLESVHFHEVGAVDAMVDIVCAAVGAEALGVDEIICSP
jgi:pyridinium-3,5-bisthiocarboxylic acid mononucleotide nickel chelatase